ncbi:MAG: hypothetical protein ACRD1N_01655, partial [Terriglobia bacterium]
MEYKSSIPIFAAIALFGLIAQPASAAPPVYHIYAGNTHSHTAYTWSHGAQYVKNGCRGIM